MADQNWRAFPTIAHAKVFIGPDDTVANGLRLYLPASTRARAARAAMRSMPDAAARVVLPKVPKSALSLRLERQSSEVCEILEEDSLRTSIAPGTPGAQCKTTVQVSDTKSVLAYAKIAENALTAELLRNEQLTLTRLRREGGNLSFDSPRLMAYRESADATILVQSPAPSDSTEAAPDLCSGHLRALLALSKIDREEMPFSSWRASLSGALSQAPEASLQCHLDRAFAILESRFGDLPIQTSFAHGDFAPWNVRVDPSGSLFIFDWELAGIRTPILNDLLHYHFMPAYLVRRLSAGASVQLLCNAARKTTEGQEIPALSPKVVDSDLYVVLYLARLCTQPFLRDPVSQRFLSACLHIAVSRVDSGSSRMRVLASAYACEPNRGSEPGVGWNTISAIAERHDVCVITRTNNARVVEEYLSSFPNPHLRFEYVDLPRWARFWKKNGRGIRLYSYLWQFLAWRRAAALCRHERFDIAHHVTFVNDWMFSFVPLLPLASVWGPIGSHPKLPRQLARGSGAWLQDRLRTSMQQCFSCVDPFYWLAARRASVVVGISDETRRRIPLRTVESLRWRTYPAAGVERAPRRERVSSRETGLKVVSIGRLVALKGFDLSVKAFAAMASSNRDAKLTIIGDGPDRSELTELVLRLGISSQVEFKSWLPRVEVLAALQGADVFLFPSLEGGGMVVLEAMAAGLPVVCMNFGGPGSFVADGCGFRVAPREREVVVRDLASALICYAVDRTLLLEHGRNAAMHVEASYLWSGRVEVIDAWYRSARLSSRFRR